MRDTMKRVEPKEPFQAPPPAPQAPGLVWVQLPLSDPKVNAQLGPPSVYDYAPGQAYMLKLYDCYRVALIGRKYHGAKKARWQRWDRWSEIVAALTASTAFVSLPWWNAAAGKAALASLVAAAAIAGIVRTVYRFSDQAHHHAGLAKDWTAVFLGIDQLLTEIRRAGRLEPEAEARIGAWIERFGVVESADESLPDRKLLDAIQADVEKAIPASSLWLPRDDQPRPAGPGPDEKRSPYPTSTPLPSPPPPPISPPDQAQPTPQPAKP